MELALLVYLVGFIEKLNTFLKGVSITALVLLTLCFFGAVAAMIEEIDGGSPLYRKLKTALKTSIITVIVSGVLMLLTPTKETFTMMIGAYAGQKVIEHPKTSEIFDKSLKAIETQLDVLIAPPKEEEKKE
ncbi:hypothetical protein ACFGY2_01510 [Pasteurella multocida]|uniref:hypothetical protein n=1 Tax=Pasteurella multocida TaxID=747 RepID=UPI000E032864|nr:hypothetical protein [Pasteurella multocida]SUB38340.1 Uncharacterised protein [Pasteurella multocida]HDR0636693.1 hypothetical protein [Pasteurella multocida]